MRTDTFGAVGGPREGGLTVVLYLIMRLVGGKWVSRRRSKPRYRVFAFRCGNGEVVEVLSFPGRDGGLLFQVGSVLFDGGEDEETSGVQGPFGPEVSEAGPPD